MKCRFCSCRVENSNEIDGYQPDGCFYGDDYVDDYCYEDKDGDYCCDKIKEEIENDQEQGRRTYRRKFIAWKEIVTPKEVKENEN